MGLLAVGAVSFAVGLSGAVTPGPLTVFTIREAARRGWRAGPLVNAGHGVVELALVVALALGLGQILGGGTATGLISLTGAAVLFVMGVGLLRMPASRLQAELDGAGRGVASAGAGPLLAVASAGALLSVANPYWVLWWASVGAKLTADSLDAGVAGAGAFFVGHVLSDLAWLTLVSVLVGSGRRRMNATIYRAVLAACGVFLVALAAIFAWTGAIALR